MKKEPYHRLAEHFRDNPQKEPELTEDTKIFNFGVNRTHPNDHDGVVTAYWEPVDSQLGAFGVGVFVGFAFCSPKNVFDKVETKRALLRIRDYGTIRGEGYGAKIRNSKFVVHIPHPSGDPLDDVAKAFAILKTRTMKIPNSNKTDSVIPKHFRNWDVTTKTYENKDKKMVSVPTIAKIENGIAAWCHQDFKHSMVVTMTNKDVNVSGTTVAKAGL